MPVCFLCFFAGTEFFFESSGLSFEIAAIEVTFLIRITSIAAISRLTTELSKKNSVPAKTNWLTFDRFTNKGSKQAYALPSTTQKTELMSSEGFTLMKIWGVFTIKGQMSTV